MFPIKPVFPNFDNFQMSKREFVFSSTLINIKLVAIGCIACFWEMMFAYLGWNDGTM